MHHATHRLWAGTLLVLSAAALLAYTGGTWATAVQAGLGVLLVLTSFEPTKGHR